MHLLLQNKILCNLKRCTDYIFLAHSYFLFLAQIGFIYSQRTKKTIFKHTNNVTLPQYMQFSSAYFYKGTVESAKSNLLHSVHGRVQYLCHCTEINATLNPANPITAAIHHQTLCHEEFNLLLLFFKPIKQYNIRGECCYSPYCNFIQTL